MNVAAVVVAAGRGERAGGGVPKQYRTVGGIPVIRLVLHNLVRAGAFSTIQPVVHADAVPLFRAACDGIAMQPPVVGGATRQASVLAGLEALVPHKPDVVLVHDAARPFVSPALIARAITAGEKGAGVPALAITDTVKIVDGGVVTATLDRNWTENRLKDVEAFASTLPPSPEVVKESFAEGYLVISPDPAAVAALSKDSFAPAAPTSWSRLRGRAAGAFWKSWVWSYFRLAGLRDLFK